LKYFNLFSEQALIFKENLLNFGFN